MADLVNSTAKEQLSPRNSEPTHLGKGGSWDILGGPTWDNKGTEADYKIDASKGVGTDTTIPKAVGAEPTHLKTEDLDEPEVDVTFDGDEEGMPEDVDAIDQELDAFDDLNPVDVDVELGDEDAVELETEEEDEEDGEKFKNLGESRRRRSLREGGGIANFGDKKAEPFDKEDAEKVNEADDEDEKKDTVEEEDDEDEKKDKIEEARQRRLRESRRMRRALREAEDKDENPFAKKDDEKVEESDDSCDDKEKLEEEDDDTPEFIIKKKEDAEDDAEPEGDDEKEEKPVSEHVKVRIKLPSAKLFESANMSAKTQKKVGVVFEAAIRDTTKQITEQLHKHYRKLYEQRVAQRNALMNKQMDAYLSYVVEEWMQANKVSIRQSLRTQLAEEFLDGLQKLFKEHYIEVPESKVNVVEKLTEDVAKLRKALNESHSQKIKLHKLAEHANKARIVAEFARNMSVASGTKLQKLAENTPYTSAKDFREKVSLLKESYFPPAAPTLKRLPAEDVQEAAPVKPGKVSVDPEINAFAQALSRQASAERW